MSAIAPQHVEAARDALLAQIERVRLALCSYARLPAEPAAALPSQARCGPLDALCVAFELSPFERDVLLLCAAYELDGSFAALCAAAQGDPQRGYPTFGLALAALDEPHWSALAPAAPLRSRRLLDLDPAGGLTGCRLQIDETILHYLAGVPQHDDRLAGYLEPVEATVELTPSQRALVADVLAVWRAGAPLPIELNGADRPTRHALAVAACAEYGLQLLAIEAAALPHAPSELAALRRLLEREALLTGSALLIEDELSGAGTTRSPAVRMAAMLAAPVFLSREAGAPRSAGIAIDVPLPTRSERRAVWRALLGNRYAELADALAAQFGLGAAEVQAMAWRASGRVGEWERGRDGETPAGRASGGVTQQSAPSLDEHATGVSLQNPELGTWNLELGTRLWDACRAASRGPLDELAQRIEPAAGWDDLVLPAAVRALLREIVVQVRHRTLVYDDWGFAARGSRGLGISALFAGDSGTGKTMAAEVLAAELRLDLYRIDLSSVVSKYIGETEKNLRRVFDAAEGGGAILLFDEADALFGKRSEVKDSHDRYANIEISYLLQRMEAYSGLAILTTNLRSALDAAFVRRLRFVVQFPFPDAAHREAIWRLSFAPGVPLAELDYARLSRLNLAGGNIRNIALAAAFLAAEAREPLGMEHLLRAARTEYAKMEKTLSDAEWGRT